MAHTQITGQSSLAAPAIVFGAVGSNPAMYHMVFVANSRGKELLYATSPDGAATTWTLGPPVNQSTAEAPALNFINTRGQNLLTVVFVEDSAARHILFSQFDPSIGQQGGWSNNFDTNESSGQGVTLVLRGNQPTLYFVAHDNTNDLFETVTANNWPP